ncbi:helix-turn-helix domain-containing protein [Mesorhizobium sp. BH1-1-5]|uniref:helix-turn-helix domain-containing protein n=1 Tax=unclassified Mesorhizobium TaxID=325217 RepID=UPI001125D500|nr:MULTISPECIES: helix-turn-helix transcriptional regulator [unclassified Mesorhizobium]MBZ9986835.1 helix-turn-helix domain-containing protein [Mesorhizobium sp. BH1-1-5]TPJ70592.1 helix-turn-helix transcriptional regulator [Mesorhizobium sp. B2-7-1]
MGCLTPGQSRAARALLKWSQVRLGAKCNLSEASIRTFENGDRIPTADELLRIRQALQAGGAVFLPQEEMRPAEEMVGSGAPVRFTDLSEGEAGIIGNSEM